MNHAPGAGDGSALERLAEESGVQLAYSDIHGQPVQAQPASVLAVLRAMGAIEDAGDIPEALRRHENAHWRWSLEPVTLAWDGRLAGLSLRLPEASRTQRAEYRIELEDGALRRGDLDLADAPTSDRMEQGGERFVQLDVTIDESLPFGYHRLTVEVAGRQLETRVIAAPRHAYQPTPQFNWGVFLPLYALHSSRSWGIGDYTDLASLVAWSRAQGGSFVGTLPLLPAFLENPVEPSPYQPVSRLLWNELYIDPEAPLPGIELPASDAALAAQARALTAGRDVDYGAVMALKRRVLSAQLAALDDDPAFEDGLTSYLDRRPLVRDYAAFRAAGERLGPDWRRWANDARNGRLTEGDYDRKAMRYHAYAQWRAETQMVAVSAEARRQGHRLYLDMPIGVHPAGYDAWRHQDLYAQGMSTGAPPDLLASEGQDWGFQPLIPNAQRASGYAYLIALLRHCMGAAGMLRIDHAIGLHRLYWIPEGATGREGVFVRQPAEELYAILCLESLRAQTVLIGEDLGLVPPEVEAGLEEHRLGRMYVQMFEMTGDTTTPLLPASSLSIASFSTHDLPTFAAYWQDQDLAQRRDLGLLTPEGVHAEMVGRRGAKHALATHLDARGLTAGDGDIGDLYRGSLALQAESGASWLVLNLEDTWAETRLQNMPGTTEAQYPNWHSRAAHSLDDFDAIEGVRRAIETVRAYSAHPKSEGD